MDWTVTYCGACDVDGITLDDEEARLSSVSWDDEIILASRQIRKTKTAQKGTMKLSLGAVISLQGTPTDGSAMLYQPISKVIGACAHKEGQFSSKHFFSYLFVSNDMHERAAGCKFQCRTFKTKNEEDATSLAFAITRTMEQHRKRGRPRGVPLSEYSVEDFENSVAWWNAGKDQMYHYRLLKSPETSVCVITGVMNISNESEVVISDHTMVDQGGVHGMMKKVKIPSDVVGDALVRMLGEKFNLDDVSISTHAVCEVKHTGEQHILDVNENPIARTFMWSDPSEGTFVLRRLPEGHKRMLLGESSSDDVLSAPNSPVPRKPADEASLGPQLPYCEEDEDLLLAVMISRQTGNGLGFKLTPAYLLQMCVAYTFVHKGTEDINRLFSKITVCVATVISENPKNPELLLFWCCNTMRFLDYIASRTDLQQAAAAAVGDRLEKALGVGLGMIAQVAEEGARLPAALAGQRWDTEEDLRSVIEKYYQSLDSNMSTTNLQEVIERITAAMPSAHLRQKVLNDGIKSPRADKLEDDGGGSQKENMIKERPNVDSLPPEWEELVDQETKHRFFANHITRQTSWTDPRDRLTTVKLTKDGKGLGIGLSGAKRTWDDRLILGIFVSSLVQNSAAAVEGTLREGDEILEVDSDSLIGVSREGAIEHLRRVPHGGTVTLLVSQEPDQWVDPDKIKASTRHTAL